MLFVPILDPVLIFFYEAESSHTADKNLASSWFSPLWGLLSSFACIIPIGNFKSMSSISFWHVPCISHACAHYTHLHSLSGSVSEMLVSLSAVHKTVAVCCGLRGMCVVSLSFHMRVSAPLCSMYTCMHIFQGNYHWKYLQLKLSHIIWAINPFLCVYIFFVCVRWVN